MKAVEPIYEDGELIDALDDDSPYCECGCQQSIEESDWNQCDSCGKPFN